MKIRKKQNLRYLVVIAVLMGALVMSLAHRAVDVGSTIATTYAIPEGYTKFTDASFYSCAVDAYLKLYPSDTISAGLTDVQLAKIKSLVCVGMGVSNTTGVEKMIELNTLSLGQNSISSIDLSKNTKLTELKIQSNQLKSLNLSANTLLTSLDASANQISSVFDVSKNTKLTAINVSGNKLSTFDVSKNDKLTDLNIYGNQITTIDVTKNADLSKFMTDSSTLIIADVPLSSSDGGYVYNFNKLKFIPNQNTVTNTAYMTYTPASKLLVVTDYSKTNGYVYFNSTSSGYTYRIGLLEPATIEEEIVTPDTGANTRDEEPLMVAFSVLPILVVSSGAIIAIGFFCLRKRVKFNN